MYQIGGKFDLGDLWVVETSSSAPYFVSPPHIWRDSQILVASSSYSYSVRWFLPLVSRDGRRVDWKKNKHSEKQFFFSPNKRGTRKKIESENIPNFNTFWANWEDANHQETYRVVQLKLETSLTEMGENGWIMTRRKENNKKKGDRFDSIQLGDDS